MSCGKSIQPNGRRGPSRGLRVVGSRRTEGRNCTGGEKAVGATVCRWPEQEVFVGPVALAPYETPGTQAFAETVLPYVKNHNTILLTNHGVVCWADTVTHAEWYVEVVDTYCKWRRTDVNVFTSKPEKCQSGRVERSAVDRQRRPAAVCEQGLLACARTDGKAANGSVSG
ncbi:MAG: class II aldolase/adducin family protein [Acidobacteriaceae bacterium]